MHHVIYSLGDENVLNRGGHQVIYPIVPLGAVV